MECQFAQRSISDYMEGDLPSEQVLELEEHLRICEDCRGVQEDLLKTVGACRALPDLHARDELWRVIQPRLSRLTASGGLRSVAPPEDAVVLLLRRRLDFYRRAAAVAAGVAVIAFSLMLGQFLWKQSVLDKPPAELAALEIWRAELHYQKAIDSLTQILDQTKVSWNVEIRQVIEQNLQAIDRSIAECLAMLEKDPQNIEAGTYLLAVYRKKVDFLRSVLDQPTPL